jgi:formiminotetrahydrofolate cyclodeaminase
MTRSYLDHTLGDFVDLVAKRQPAPGGGAVAAITVSCAAGLVAMAARYSAESLEDSEELVAEAERLRTRVAGLADEDARAYSGVIAAYDSVRQGDDNGSERLRVALTRATEVPLEVAEAGAETARLAALLAVDGKRDVRGDAATALLLAEAATRSAAGLVAINVEAGGGDSELVLRAGVCVMTARDAAARLE